MYKFLAKNIFPIVGGMFVGFGIPLGTPLFSRGIDMIFLPIGIVILSISYYENFIRKNDK